MAKVMATGPVVLAVPGIGHHSLRRRRGAARTVAHSFARKTLCA